MESDQRSNFLVWSHFLRRTGIHFVGKCSGGLWSALRCLGEMNHMPHLGSDIHHPDLGANSTEMLNTTPANTIAICAMRHMETWREATGATRIISVVNAHLMPPTPPAIEPAHHLRLAISDARAEPGQPHPARPQIEELIQFVRDWPQDAPLLIHCFSGLNRSPAAAYIALAVLNPYISEVLIAYRLRAASDTAAPNRTMVGLADLQLGRDGNLSAAMELIGPGQPAAEGRPFVLSTTFNNP